MVEQLLNHIHRHQLCKTTDKILLAVSGGLDSMVMLHLFRQAGIPFGVAHCNFQLRGENSKADEALVNSVCVEWKIPFYLKSFETEKFANENKLSIQMAARQLRYDFFGEVLSANHYDFIATAHHLNDSFETTLLNLVKGTGIDGLKGISVKNGNVIRPMLFATREMISAWADFARIEWREDLSNLTDDYQRNLIRNKITPLLKVINPNLEETFRNTSERISAAAKFADNAVAGFINEFVRIEGNSITINKKALSVESAAVLLWSVLRDFSFNFDQCVDIQKEHQSGKKFLSSTHELIVDREALIVHPIEKEVLTDVKIGKDSKTVFNGNISLEISLAKDWSKQSNGAHADLDFERLEFPLTWRRWKNGDSFKPLGMETHKKVSDFLIDLKIPLHEKENVTVLESAGKIAWVVGHRISHEFRITAETRQVLSVSAVQKAARKSS